MRSSTSFSKADPETLRRLAETIATPTGEHVAQISTGHPQLDQALGGRGIRLGVVHEWFPDEAVLTPEIPLGMPIRLARRALDHAEEPGALVFWIGRRAWPYPRILHNGPTPRLLHASLFVDADETEERLWAIDLVLRSHAVAAVVADGSGLTMAHSRRLQLAAQGGRALCMLLRPAREIRQISAAWTRWRVRPVPSPDTDPRWTVELLRCKGVQPATQDAHQWVAQHDHETGDVRLVSLPLHRPAPQTTEAVRQSA